MSKSIGLTGGICCGKSTVSKTLKSHNIPIVDADMVAREVVLPKSKGLKQIVAAFGEEYLRQDGFLDRQKLGSLVFEKPESLIKINEIMAPLIVAEADRQLNELHSQGHNIVIYDAALIVEMGHADKYRPLIMVHCTKEQQLERLMKRGTGHGPLTEAEAMARIATQMPIDEKIKYADHVIDTSGTIEESVAQTLALIKIIKL